MLLDAWLDHVFSVPRRYTNALMLTDRGPSAARNFQGPLRQQVGRQGPRGLCRGTRGAGPC